MNYKEMKEFFGFMGCLIVTLLLLTFTIVLPLSWFDGQAKSAYLKQTQGLDIPWHQATWLDVKIQNVDANIHQKESK